MSVSSAGSPDQSERCQVAGVARTAIASAGDGEHGGLTPERTALANRLAQSIHRLSPETVAALHSVLDATTTRAEKPRLRRAAGAVRVTPRPRLS
jgi:hypothetical protein